MSPLAKKLQMKPATQWLLFNPPENYLAALEPLPEGANVAFELRGNFDGAQLFVKDTADLTDSLKIVVPVLKKTFVLWIIYPKKSSGIKSDLEMMSGWNVAKEYGLKPVAVISVDKTYTALRLSKEDQIKISEGRNDQVRQNEHGVFIDIDKKQVTLPPEIAEVLTRQPIAMSFYESLSYSNKKEYVLWILTAKQEKTKSERLIKLVEKLLDGKKNPSEK
jgi:hypothetical protein